MNTVLNPSAVDAGMTAGKGGRAAAIWPFAVAIFLGAFLLFQVQPIIGRYILPWFGGAPGVWTACMLFFQVLLLGGYAYAHFSIQKLSPRGQAVVHLALLGVCVVLLNVTPGEGWKPHTAGEIVNPTWRIVALLAVHVGLPFFALSATGPLLQAWVSRGTGGKAPYRLYALSNLGSLLALVSYPFVFEPMLGRKMQAEWWSWGMRGFVVACAGCAVVAWRWGARAGEADRPAPSQTAGFSEGITAWRWVLWFLLPASASVLLLATTNKICQDIAVVPFLWVLPLALYLLSFVLTFESPRWYWRRIYMLAMAAGLGLVIYDVFRPDDDYHPLLQQVALYAGVMFVACMIFHGELVRLKPAARHLTGFYLMIAAGGAAGGIFVGVVAPVIFSDYRELEIGYLMCAVLPAVVMLLDKGSPFYARWQAVGTRQVQGGAARTDDVLDYAAGSGRWRNRWMRFAWMTLAGVMVLGAAGLQLSPLRASSRSLVARYRSFYGVLSIFEYNVKDPTEHYRTLQHGRITHGLQYLDPRRRDVPTSYYEAGSGVGLAIEELTGEGPRHIGVVGLGTGTVAAYGRKGDRVRFYEINPQVEELARKHFTYLADCEGKVEVVLGDARLSMEREEAQGFDVLVLDAFSGDAIPVHLLTKEAIAIYLRHLKERGVIAVHVSNQYLDLEPVVARLAEHFGLHAKVVNYMGGDYASDWVLVAREESVLEGLKSADAGIRKAEVKKGPLWTDDHASLLAILSR